MADDLIEQAIGALHSGVAPMLPSAAPEQQSTIMQLLPHILPALALGAGAALTSPNRSKPQIIGRGLLGATAGFGAGSPTQRDLYYQERLQDYHARRTALEQQTTDRDAYAASLPEEKRSLFLQDPHAYVTHELAQQDRKPNVALLTKVFGADADQLSGIDSKDLSHITSYVIEHDYANQHRPMKLHVVDNVPITQPDGTQKPGYGVLDLNTNKMVGPPILKYEEPKASDPIKAQEAKILDEYLEHGAAGMTPEKLRVVNKLLALNPQQAIGAEIGSGGSTGATAATPDNDPLGIR